MPWLFTSETEMSVSHFYNFGLSQMSFLCERPSPELKKKKKLKITVHLLFSVYLLSFVSVLRFSLLAIQLMSFKFSIKVRHSPLSYCMKRNCESKDFWLTYVERNPIYTYMKIALAFSKCFKIHAIS